MDPVQPPRHPRPGLVKVRHRRGGELVADHCGELAQAGCALDHHGGQRPDRHAGAQHVAKQPRRPIDRQVLVDAQVGDERTHPGAVLGRRAHRLGEPAGSLHPAGAAAPLSPVLGRHQPQRRQVKQLAGRGGDHRRVGQVGAAARTPVRDVHHDLVGLGDLGQVRTRGARLLARLAAPTLAPRDPRRLAQPIL